jgi:hypothetical protein
MTMRKTLLLLAPLLLGRLIDYVEETAGCKVVAKS